MIELKLELELKLKNIKTGSKKRADKNSKTNN